MQIGRYADGPSLVLHGGAGSKPGRDYKRELDHMRGLAEAGRDHLRLGGSALDVVTMTVAALEASGLYIAGRGASPNAQGCYELDASVMNGPTRSVGAVATLVGFQSPIAAARAVMEKTPHVLLAGAGAAAFAREQGLAEVIDPAEWFTRAGQDESNHWPAGPAEGAAALAHGTVGCVVRDAEGRLAAATSTAGVFQKLPGRVGDTPVPGAGVWADDIVAVSCTGQGEFFLRTAAAAAVAHRMRWAQASVVDAARESIAEVVALGGEGGLIAVDFAGRITMPFASAGMKRASATPDGEIFAGAF